MNYNQVLPNPSITSLGAHPPLNPNVNTLSVPARTKKELSPLEANLDGFGGQFYHNNMVPFHSGKVKQNVNVCTSKLSYMAGSSSEPRKKKVEQVNIFKPIHNKVSTHNSNQHNFKDKIAKPAYHKNAVPVEKVLVGPALNKGYDEKGSDGFHPMFRPTYKTVDQLNVKEKMTGLKGRVIAGKISENRGILGKVEKRGPEQVYENSIDYSNILGKLVSSIRNIFHVDETRRSITTSKSSRLGNAESIVKKIVNVDNAPEFKCDRQIIFKSRTGNTAVQSLGNYVSDGYVAPETIRQTTEHFTVTGPVSNISRQQSQLQDEAKQTIRQTTEKLSLTGPVSNISKQQVQLQDKAKSTIRESTEESTITGTIDKTESMGTYVSDGIIAPNTLRETTEESTITGSIDNTGAMGTYVSDGIVAPNTIRETTEDAYRLGGIGGLERGHHTIDLDTKLDSTMREMMQKEGIVTGTLKGHKVALEDEAKHTLRETTEQSTVLGSIVSDNKSTYINNGQEAKNTLRQTTEGLSLTGAVGTMTNMANTASLQDQARHTIRESTEESTVVGSVSNYEKNTMGLQDEMRPTIRESTTTTTKSSSIDTNKSGYAVLPEKLRSTLRESTENLSKLNNIQKISEVGQSRLLDEVRHSIKEDFVDKTHTSAPNAKASQDGYLIAEHEVLHTLKEDSLMEDYLGQGDASYYMKPINHEQYENAETNSFKEKTLENREMAFQGEKMHVLPEQLNVQCNKKSKSEVELPMIMGKMPNTSIPNQSNLGKVHLAD